MKRVVLLISLALFFLSLWLTRSPAALAAPLRPPAWLEALVFRPSPMILPPLYREPRVNTDVTIGLSELLRRNDEIVLATIAVGADEKHYLPVAEIVRVEGANCFERNMTVVCRAFYGPQKAQQPQIRVQYESLVRFCPAQGALHQVAYYNIGGQTASMVEAWIGGYTIECDSIPGTAKSRAPGVSVATE